MPKVKGLFQRGGQGEWFYDFTVRGHRFSGTTGEASRREAEKWLTEFRRQKTRRIEEFDGSGKAMTFLVASTRWWNEAGANRKDKASLEFSMEWLQREIGKSRRIDTIDNNLLAQLVAKRRLDPGKKGAITPATINRSMVEPLRAILNRASKVWGQVVKDIDWKLHKQKEPQERIREMTTAEETLLFKALRSDFHPIVRFMLITGLRRAEACGLTWDRVDMSAARIVVHGKGGTVAAMPMPRVAMAILREQSGRHASMVFTYEVQHYWGGEVGGRVPIAPHTLGTAYWRARKQAGIADLKLHDMRHTAATRILRAGGNLKTVQRLLRHERITTTARYAHVNDDDLLAAMEATNPVASPVDTSDAEPKLLKPKGKK